MVLLEAQATGTPVVAGAAAASLGDGDGETGLLTPEGDASAFAAAVRNLDSRSAPRRNMGQAAMSLMAHRHDISVAAEVLSAELEAIAAAYCA